MLWVLLVFIKIRWIFSVKDTLGFFIINFIPPRNLYQIILGISINHKAHEKSGVSQWHHWDVLAGSPGDGISTPAANPTFLGNSQTPGTSGRLIIDISGAGLSLRTLPDVGKYLLIAFSCLTNPNFLCLRCWVNTFQEPFLDEVKDYFLMEIRNLRRAGGSDSRWSLHLILMETEQI